MIKACFGMVNEEFEHFEQPKKEFLKALKASLGIVATAAKKANLSRTNHYYWLEQDEEYAKAVADIDESLKDFGESMLLEIMKSGNAAAIIFFAKTKLKDRGYSEKDRGNEESTDNTFNFNLVLPDDDD